MDCPYKRLSIAIKAARTVVPSNSKKKRLTWFKSLKRPSCKPSETETEHTKCTQSHRPKRAARPFL
jgi:hypothetical protein